MKFHRNCSANGMFVSNYMLWRCGEKLYNGFTQRLSNSDTPSSVPLSHPAECHPIFGNDGIVYFTRRLNLVISSNLHTVFVGLIPLCPCDNCCIVYLYTGLHP